MNADYFSSFEFIWDLWEALWVLFASLNRWVNLRLDEALEAVISLVPVNFPIDIPTINVTILDIVSSELLIMFLIMGIFVFIWRAIKEFIPF